LRQARQDQLDRRHLALEGHIEQLAHQRAVAVHVRDLVADLALDDARRLLQQQLVEGWPAPWAASRVARLAGRELGLLRAGRNRQRNRPSGPSWASWSSWGSSLLQVAPVAVMSGSSSASSGATPSSMCADCGAESTGPSSRRRASTLAKVSPVASRTASQPVISLQRRMITSQ